MQHVLSPACSFVRSFAMMEIWLWRCRQRRCYCEFGKTRSIAAMIPLYMRPFSNSAPLSWIKFLSFHWYINLHKQIPWNAYTLSILVALPLRFPFSFSCPIVYSHCINCEHLYYILSTLLISSSQMHNLHLKVPMQDTCKWYGKKARINWKGMDTDKNLFADVHLNRFLLMQTEILDLEVSLSWEHWRHSAGVSHNLIL